MSRTLWWLMAIVGVLAGPARAQTGPEGNAHPQSSSVSAPGEVASPFGDVSWSYAESSAEDRIAAWRGKVAFAEAVDLSPLRGVCVLHNGRVKILDTLARETVRGLTGRSKFEAIVAGDDGSPEGVKFDPVFTWLDIVIDPAASVDQPLLHVEYLPLRREYLLRAYPADEAARDRWLRLARLAPMVVQQHAGPLLDRFALQAGYSESFGDLDRAMELYMRSGDNALFVAPDRRDLPWAHLGSLPEDHPARAAAAELGRAWRATDAPAATAAAARLAAELAAIHPEVQPRFRRAVELEYSRWAPFDWGMWVYGLAFLLLTIAFGTGRRWLIVAGTTALSAAVLLHGAGFAARCVVAERYAIQNQFESMMGLSLFGSVVGLVLMIARRRWLFGAAAAGVGFLMLTAATQTGVPGQSIGKEAAILNTSVLLKYHVTTVLCSYGLITMGFFLSLFYVVTDYATRAAERRARTAAPVAGAMAATALGPEADGLGRTGVLRELDATQLIMLQLAFWTLGVGILLGAWWADHSWGRWWAWDPKETWALATWIIYLIVIHARLAAGARRGLVTAWLSVLGFVVMLWTYFGVNLLLSGLHSYA